MDTADQYLNIFPSDLLAAVVRREVDLHEVAAIVLAGRGLDTNVKWVGFEEAERIRIAAAGLDAK